MDASPRVTDGSRDIGRDQRATHVTHSSLFRVVLLAGAEPAVVIVESTIAFALVFVVGLHLVTIVFAGFWLTAVHSTMVWVAKQDPQMVELYIRSLSGRDYYAPHARAHAPARPPRPSIPRAY